MATESNDRRESFEIEDSGQVSALLPVTRRVQLLTLVSAFLTICITIGLNQSYGIFQTAYTSPETTILAPDEATSRALVAFVGTLGQGLTWAGSIVVNPLMARVRSVRYITFTGSVLMSLGLSLASLSTKVGNHGEDCKLCMLSLLMRCRRYICC